MSYEFCNVHYPEAPENQAVNHINTTASLSDPDPETPEDRRKNVFEVTTTTNRCTLVKVV